MGCSLAGFVLIMLGVSSAAAETPLEDIIMNLSIETQDLVYDFDDNGESVQKERIVIYSLEVVNQGSSTLNNLRIFMDSPDYMDYQTGSSTLQQGLLATPEQLPDEAGYSALALGYFLDTLPAGEHYIFESQYQVVVPESVLDDPLYTIAWASLLGPYSTIPVMSNTVDTIISESAEGTLSVQVIPYPSEETTVFSGSTITYQYRLSNSGGLPIQDVRLVTFEPEGTECVENCGATIRLEDDLEAGATESIDMKVRVTTTDPEKDFITNIGFDAATKTMELTEVRKEEGGEINHPLNAEIEVGSGEFTLFTEQVPNLVLNSVNGQPRPDKADITETQYAIKYTGTNRTNVFINSGNFGVSPGGPSKHNINCIEKVPYPHHWDAQVYAYNSSGASGCVDLALCEIKSGNINFSISTTLPSDRPSLVFPNGSHTKTEPYTHKDGDGNIVNRYMSEGGIIIIPPNFTLAWAIEDGAVGSSESFVSAIVTEDLWQYRDSGEEESIGSCSCGEECSYTVYKPIYKWEKVSSTNISPMQEGDDDTAQISVYSSTAWLKTEGGHVGTNGAIINNETEANYVNLEFGGGIYMNSNEYIYDPDRILTPTNTYTKFGETNSDYMIFANQGNEAFVSDAGESWIVTGTDFGPQQHGGAYDRVVNPRSYKDDLLDREKFGQVHIDQLPTLLQGSVPIGDDVIWHQTGDLTIGAGGTTGSVTFTGGQSRIYVDGDVYINANIYYGSNGGDAYNNVTSLRIDAQNIYINGEVTDLEVLLQARGEFHSGESNYQLRILGDVITDNAYWERKPVLEISPDEVNKPSEYIIEDLRKYVIPVPGDTELPDEYDIWRQVNPSTGQVLDAY